MRGDSRYAGARGDGMMRSRWHRLRLRLRRIEKPLSAKVEATADTVHTKRALTGNAVVRGYAETCHEEQINP